MSSPSLPPGARSVTDGPESLSSMVTSASAVSTLTARSFTYAGALVGFTMSVWSGPKPSAMRRPKVSSGSSSPSSATGTHTR